MVRALPEAQKAQINLLNLLDRCALVLGVRKRRGNDTAARGGDRYRADGRSRGKEGRDRRWEEEEEGGETVYSIPNRPCFVRVYPVYLCCSVVRRFMCASDRSRSHPLPLLAPGRVRSATPCREGRDHPLQIPALPS